MVHYTYALSGDEVKNAENKKRKKDDMTPVGVVPKNFADIFHAILCWQAAFLGLLMGQWFWVTSKNKVYNLISPNMGE